MMVATTTFMLARWLITKAIIKAMRKASLLQSVLKGIDPSTTQGVL